eukprot:CAMPEP_0206415464 /NCGR_PEP_ID=MMETSP0294-20121207/36118_1 /ASSEMBLY_ACC=CAM_ASM_000327 /TAXON_ID=39354 /ORGANISM="Heterosigma akashiwo, Strain CCMP2393" /LENGTH=109 /DNA_ID=CAMNT_0053877835 /DNA_START=379 /DNA_END=708 /DNA_ORIENTATION=+
MANHLRDELQDKLLKVALGGLLGHDGGHLGPDGLQLRALGVRGLLNLVGHALCETDAENSDKVAIGGLHVHVGLDNRLPLLDEGAELISGEIHAVEVGERVVALHVLYA